MLSTVLFSGNIWHLFLNYGILNKKIVSLKNDFGQIAEKMDTRCPVSKTGAAAPLII